MDKKEFEARLDKLMDLTRAAFADRPDDLIRVVAFVNGYSLERLKEDIEGKKFH
jgi:hypothetical protein